MNMRERFIPIIPIHAKMLERLIAQKGLDMHGAIGWGFPYEWNESRMPATWLEDLWKPLLTRAMVEDLAGILGPAGEFFVRITPLGEACAGLGLMYMAPRAAKASEMEALTKEVREQAERQAEPTEAQA